MGYLGSGPSQDYHNCPECHEDWYYIDYDANSDDMAYRGKKTCPECKEIKKEAKKKLKRT